MKKKISLALLLCLFILIGSSDPKGDIFEGKLGTYEWVKTIDIGKTHSMNEEYTFLKKHLSFYSR